jgi:hypothetical protein
MSNSVQWTVTGSPIPAGATNAPVTLSTMETCTGWAAGTTGNCSEELNISLMTSCGTVTFYSLPAVFKVNVQ